MKPPATAKIYDWETSTSWFDEDGIFCSVQKRVKVQSFEETKKAFDVFRKTVGTKKVCMLVDASEAGESLKESRDYAAQEFPKMIKALAIISNSSLGKMLANLFFKIKSQPYPVKMFSNDLEAKEWLKQYL